MISTMAKATNIPSSEAVLVICVIEIGYANLQNTFTERGYANFAEHCQVFLLVG